MKYFIDHVHGNNMVSRFFDYKISISCDDSNMLRDVLSLFTTSHGPGYDVQIMSRLSGIKSFDEDTKMPVRYEWCYHMDRRYNYWIEIFANRATLDTFKFWYPVSDVTYRRG